MRKIFFVFFVLFPFIHNFMYGIIPVQERAALIDLYKATNGDHWRNRRGWKVLPLSEDGFSMPGTEIHWYGIVIEGNNVTKIQLNNNNLTGTLPSTLENLSELYRLYLERNRIRGTIPPQIGNLNRLRHFSLRKNKFSGNIPPEVENLRNLQTLSLGHNQLSGSIPYQIGNLSNLKILLLGHNELSGSIPSQLELLGKLQYLYLDNNRLSGEIPFMLAGLRNNMKLDISYNCLHASDSTLWAWLDTHNPGWWIHQDQCAGTQMAIHLNCTQLHFCALESSLQNVTGPQEVWITRNSVGKLNWSINKDAPWYTCTPNAGTGNGMITVSVNPTGLSKGTYNGAITITDPNAVNSPRYISVTLKIKPDSEEMPPFGAFLTPADGSNVSSSIPVTGWALDDIGIQSVKIYREEGKILEFIGNAVFADSARPDIEEAYPGYPLNYKAGWGYMMLTNSLPNGGNGVFKLHALAVDVNGNITNLGSKIITVDNAHAVKPFGYIDTPTQCGIASGKDFVNWGWALTPQPNYIPDDGSTISVCVDGVKLGQPIYNMYREDIVAMFPEYSNSDGAVGKFYLDTTTFQNGNHTLYWSVTDDAGNTDGIGSRYFSILNTNPDNSSAILNDRCRLLNEERTGLFPGARSVVVKKGYNDELNPREIYPDEKGFIHVQSRELERIVIILKDTGIPTSYVNGYMVVGNETRPLPIGSTLDAGRGVFYWQPGPGFIGKYHLIFMEEMETGPVNRKDIIISISPKYPLTEQ
ncbi:MAG TPA: Ig-like domain-containing protein [Candidatus Kapabacteria bacterium]|nr:Ig-like domain-containing protein [Candidatus Kapabacteria bacterium]